MVEVTQADRDAIVIKRFGRTWYSAYRKDNGDFLATAASSKEAARLALQNLSHRNV